MEKQGLIREKVDVNGNSIYTLKASHINKIYDKDAKSIKFDYNVKNETITIFGDVKSIYVIYEKL